MNPPVSVRGAGRALVVIGAALGAGRWLSEHVLSGAEWARVYLIDSDRSRTALRELDWSFEAPLTFGRSVEAPGSVHFELDEGEAGAIDAPQMAIGSGDTVVCIAVPPVAFAAVAEAVFTLVPRPSSVLVSVASMERSLSELRRLNVSMATVTGVHALNDSAAPSALGQTVYLVPGTDAVDPWIARLVESVGGVPKVGTANEHDRVMSVIQALTHRVLIAFADAVTASGLSLEDELWLARTPLFEALLGLSARVLVGAR